MVINVYKLMKITKLGLTGISSDFPLKSHFPSRIFFECVFKIHLQNEGDFFGPTYLLPDLEAVIILSGPTNSQGELIHTKSDDLPVVYQTTNTPSV